MDFLSSANEVLINPRFPEEERERLGSLIQKAPELSHHVWIATSGSTAESVAEYKWTALSKFALLESAKSVNKHLNSDKNDIWFHTLPDFHVGGLGIRARAFLSGAQVIEFKAAKWDAKAFHTELNASKATLTSLVPAQVYDLISFNLKAPPSLRALIIGGGALANSLYEKARSLHWPLLPSYGMTECSSQIATADLSNAIPHSLPLLRPLTHVQLKVDDMGKIAVKSPSLLTLYAYWKGAYPNYVDPKKDGWFQTEDKGNLTDGLLSIFGRESGFVKIGGESVDMNRLEKILDDLRLEIGFKSDCALLAVPEERLGSTICLCVASQNDHEAKALAARFKDKVLPFEQIRRIHLVPHIPRTPLQKLCKTELLCKLNTAPMN